VKRFRPFAQISLRTPILAMDSPLRDVDPRAKLALSTCASLAVMMRLERLALFMVFYVVLLLWARLLLPTGRQIWRIKWLLLALFVIDWLVVGVDLAVVVTLRLILLTGVFTLFVGTTTPDEFRLALEALHLPYRYAFSLSMAFQSLDLLSREWWAIQEAQRSRGALGNMLGLRAVVTRLGDWVALTVPAIVLATRRAWAMTEAACARGFDAPKRRPYLQLTMGWLDGMLVVFVLMVVGGLLFV
jgi:energy-coupling factor transporter transmembrane protein EcfT